ncbi:hypothetical protein G6F22_014435 [Rhizopus arrhizus]|nr:hypothetical protein G6F22_014435 [Rhizopus arrhizus]
MDRQPIKTRHHRLRQDMNRLHLPGQPHQLNFGELLQPTQEDFEELTLRYLRIAVFDLKQLSVLPTDFYEALANQYPSAIGAVPVCQGAINGVIIAFDFAESRTAACSVALSRYGTVLHVGLYRDPVSRLFFGKGYALIDTAPEDRTILPLSHEIDLTNQRLIYASWRGMAPHCFYCHKPGHMKGNCPRLSQQRIKTCYSCGDPSHLIRERPKRNTATVGEKRTRYDNPLPTVPVSFSSLTLGSSSTQNSSSPTPILSAVSKSVKGIYHYHHCSYP